MKVSEYSIAVYVLTYACIHTCTQA